MSRTRRRPLAAARSDNQRHRILQQPGGVERLRIQRQASSLDAGHVQHVADHAQQGVAGRAHQFDPALLLRVQGRLAQQAGEPQQGIEWRTDLVAHGGQEARLGGVGGLGRRLGLGQAALGGRDVAIHTDHATVRHQALDRVHHPAVAQLLFPHPVAGSVQCKPGFDPRRVRRLVAVGQQQACGCLGQPPVRHADAHHPSQVGEQLQVTAVPAHQPVVGVAQQEGLRHRGQGLIQGGGRLRQRPAGLVQARQVDMGRHGHHRGQRHEGQRHQPGRTARQPPGRQGLLQGQADDKDEVGVDRRSGRQQGGLARDAMAALESRAGALARPQRPQPGRCQARGLTGQHRAAGVLEGHDQPVAVRGQRGHHRMQAGFGHGHKARPAGGGTRQSQGRLAWVGRIGRRHAQPCRPVRTRHGQQCRVGKLWRGRGRTMRQHGIVGAVQGHRLQLQIAFAQATQQLTGPLGIDSVRGQRHEQQLVHAGQQQVDAQQAAVEAGRRAGRELLDTAVRLLHRFGLLLADQGVSTRRHRQHEDHERAPDSQPQAQRQGTSHSHGQSHQLRPAAAPAGPWRTPARAPARMRDTGINAPAPAPPRCRAGARPAGRCRRSAATSAAAPARERPGRHDRGPHPMPPPPSCGRGGPPSRRLARYCS
jgi:hypothetical protein